MTTKIKNSQTKEYVEALQEFQASNLFAICHPGAYVVYSYRTSYPIYANIKGRWYGNSQTHSKTTSCHKSQARPRAEIEFVGLDELKEKIYATANLI